MALHLQPIVSDGARNLAFLTSEFRSCMDKSAAIAAKTESVANTVREILEKAGSVIKEALDKDFAGLRRKEMLAALVSLDRVKGQCDSVLANLQGLSRTLAMNNPEGTRTEAEMADRWDKFLAAVQGGDEEAFTAYKRHLNAWSVRLTKDAKELLTNGILTTAKDNVEKLRHISRSEVAVGVGAVGLGATCLVSAAVVIWPPLGICFGVAAVLGGYRSVKYRMHQNHVASTLDKALAEVEELLRNIVTFDSTFVKCFGEDDHRHEQVQALEDLCRNGGWPGQLENLLSELQGTVQALA